MQEVSVLSNNSSQQNFRSKGTCKSGHVKRGIVQNAEKKILTGCIPSKYENVVLKNDAKKAFGTTTGRFSIDKECNTGPGSYISSQNTTVDQTVYSKKGLGNGFISQVQRNIFGTKYLNMGPGPGQYKQPIPSFTENLDKEIEQKKQITQFYRKEQKIVKKQKQYNMGPGDYSPKKAKIFQNTYVSSFVTKYQRDEYRKKKETPCPGQYENQKDIYSPKKYHSGCDWFCKDQVPKVLKPMNDLIKFIQQPKKEEEAPEQQKEQDVDNWMFQEGAKDRFGDKQPIDMEQILGPGHYPSDTFYSIQQKYTDKNYVSSNVFMSETERQPFGAFDKRLGPSCIVPFLPARKKDTHLNLQHLWM